MKNSKKYFRKTHSRVKKRLTFLRRHPLLLPVSLFLAVFFSGLMLFVMLGATTKGAQDVRIVNLYIDNEKQTVSTRAKTVEELIQRLDIDLIEEDIIEPARETAIIEDNTQVNVYRARPVAVVDGDRIITVLSAHQSPRLVAAEANVKLFPQDEVTFARSDDPNILESSVPEQVLIDRSVPVQLNVYGVVSSIRTTADTVGEFLEERNITVASEATLQPADRNTPITSGLLIAVNRVGIITESVLEIIPHGIEFKNDPNLTVGESRVEQEGIDGEQAVIYEITEMDGKEVSRTAIQTVVTQEPVTEVRVRGTKPATLSANLNLSAEKTSLMAAAGISPGDYSYVDYIVSKESGWRPGALNAYSGAYGLCQALPGSKMASAGDDWRTNPVTQLRWCSGYATGRYGSWQGAYNAWLAQGWW